MKGPPISTKNLVIRVYYLVTGRTQVWGSPLWYLFYCVHLTDWKVNNSETISVVLYDCMTVWLYDCVTITVWLYFFISVWLCYCVTVWLYFCISYDCVTVWLWDCMTVFLFFCLTVWLYDCVTVWPPEPVNSLPTCNTTECKKSQKVKFSK